MDFSLTEEQQMLKDSAARFVRESYDFDRYRAIVATPTASDPQVWAQLAEMGWLGLPFADEDGGLGCGHVELMLLAEELGRGLCIEPFLANVVLAGQLLARVGNASERATLLQPMIRGEQQLALAHAEIAGRHDPVYCQTRASQHGDGWVLEGRKSAVLNAGNAQSLLVLARVQGEAADPRGLGLFLICAHDLSPSSYAVLGGGSGAELVLDKVPAQRIGGDITADWLDVWDLAVAYSCAEAYGAMQAMLDKTVEYSKTRKQFGVPLCSFQVLQHRMVDMFIEVQQSQSMVLMMMLRLTDARRETRQHAVSAGKAYLHKASKFVAQQAVQLHGGIGVTEELDIGHYFRRLTAFGLQFGDRRHHLQRLAKLRRGDAADQTMDAAA